MPHDYDETKRRFTKNGRTVDPKTVRELIDELTSTVQKDARRLAARLESGKITVAQFKTAMRELLKSGHIVASSVGRGGLDRMTQTDWARVGRKIKWQYGYLDKFARKIEQGRISTILTAHRAQSYASALRVSFYQSRGVEAKEGPSKDRPRVRRILNAKESCAGCLEYAAMGWIDVDEMPEIGELECGDYDLCDLEFSDDVTDDE